MSSDLSPTTPAPDAAPAIAAPAIAAPAIAAPAIAERGVIANGVRIASAMSDSPRDVRGRVALVALPSVGFVWRDYHALLAAIARERRVFALDWPGFGASAKPAPAAFDYSPVGLTTCFAAWLDGLGVTRAVLLGNGLGAEVALRYAAEHPRRVAGLALISPLGVGAPDRIRAIASRLIAAPRLTKRIEPLLTSLMIGPLSTPDARAVAAHHTTLRAATDHNATLAALSALWLATLRASSGAQPALDGALASVNAPTLVIRGALDPMATEADAQHAADALGVSAGGRALRIALPEAGHLPFLQQPARFTQALSGLLATAETTAPATPTP